MIESCLRSPSESKEVRLLQLTPLAKKLAMAVLPEADGPMNIIFMPLGRVASEDSIVRFPK